MGVNAALVVALTHSLVKLRPSTTPPTLSGVTLAQNEYESMQVCDGVLEQRWTVCSWLQLAKPLQSQTWCFSPSRAKVCCSPVLRAKYHACHTRSLFLPPATVL
jgi:hypothetical protein